VQQKITLGTRGSKLALVQANWVADALRRFHQGLRVELVTIKTTGDKNLRSPLAEIGGKGAFTKELEDAIFEGRCDIAVHSLKDLPTNLPAGLRVLCTPLRENTADVLLATGRDHKLAGQPLPQLAEGARVGTSSLRRRALLARLRPDLKIVEFRGNVDSRLRKLKHGDVDACILATAGLSRLGLIESLHGGAVVDGLPCQFLLPPQWLPAPGQGALGIEGKDGDAGLVQLLAPLHDAGTFAATAAERAFLRTLGAGCQSPVAALAQSSEGSTLRLVGQVYSRDGRKVIGHEAVGGIDKPEELGESVAQACLRAGAGKLVQHP